ncbi:MAG: RluA family pseudouridine synthase [Pseudobutyrivibrio sp.]|jgi:23S rRNA pseudouridine1911/1915/1917 synthase|uniref:Pseudouridine synthase n=2 Tax=Pseudobutyrivibrio TaxID=46205 RepID=A0A2G3DVG0_9FIRM|nr:MULTISPECIES: RluA family pseudouridine synthase [Pseudobutyrivibrio]MBE5904016.1 RluA family pseudouridine synthase [Pseudobutyrivibrio sp.]NEX01150.1 RluA family pseudouridine synthase [Pseudobutyrivibrio xylanivorans]PHU35037.1 RluA family pseudouridine synthase [Pseudobutyrivibrio ruminis]SCX77551.1 23S rRNA pseudouridine1911/1915/1917 synthase [Pseudobutyrivibrio sp. AR14]SFR65370.1 23S rRNA pseudouridine1911/1915/1917 synthase [Pseudobutyrivibrio sp. NOR37]
MDESLIVIEEPSDAGIRIDKFLASAIPDKSRSHYQKAIDNGLVLVNGKTVKSKYQTRLGDEIVISIEPVKEIDILPEDIPIDILYEDNDVIVVNKPKGMVVHPAPGHYSGTLVNALMFHCKDSLSGINGEIRPGIVHRIDMNTTGSLLVCKNDKAHNDIAAQIKVHSVNRIYKGIVIGNFKEEEGTVDAPIGRNPKDRKKMAVVPNGREAVTHFTVLEQFKGYSYVQFKLETGRTHQIRVHMAHIGHPLLGDDVYGKPVKNLEGQTLHAQTLGFKQPTTGEYVEVNAPLPSYFEELLNKYRKMTIN